MKKIFLFLSFALLSTVSSFAKEFTIAAESTVTETGTLTCGVPYTITAENREALTTWYKYLECLICSKCDQPVEGEVND